MVCSVQSPPPLPKHARSTWDLLAAEVESIHDDSITGAKRVERLQGFGLGLTL